MSWRIKRCGSLNAYLEQIESLESRGLLIANQDQALSFLKTVSFFRLTPYMRPLQVRVQGKPHFKKGVTFEQLTRLYEFDRRLAHTCEPTQGHTRCAYWRHPASQWTIG